MFKLATVLCALVLFGSRAFVAARKLDDPRISATRSVAFARGCVQRRSHMIGNLIRETAALPSGEYAGMIEELKRNMTEELSLARLLVNDIITDPSVNVTFNETKCRSFYEDHERDERNIDKNLDHHLTVALNATLTRLQKAKDAADAALEQINNLKREAASCDRRKCLTVEARADAIRSRVFSQLSGLSCLDKSPSKGMEFILQMAFSLFEDKGQTVFLETYKCIYNGHPPPIQHHHHHHQLNQQA